MRYWVERDGNTEIVTVAHAVGSRAMRRTTLFSVKQVADERDRAAAVPMRGAAPEGRLAAAAFAFAFAFAFAKETVAWKHVNDVLRVQDFMGGSEAELACTLRKVHDDRERSAKTPTGKARSAQFAARVLLSLHKPDEAEP